jgi:hypothetical protein
MFRHLRQAYLLIRDVRMLTDLLTWGQNNGSTIHVFKWMGYTTAFTNSVQAGARAEVDLGLEDSTWSWRPQREVHSAPQLHSGFMFEGCTGIS